MIFAEDEIGAEGRWGEDSRTAFPWDAPDQWDRETLEVYRQLIGLRTASDALAYGGLRFVEVQDDCIAFLRESPQERLLILVSRDAHKCSLELADLSAGQAQHVYGFPGEIRSDSLEVTMPSAGGSIWRLP